MKIASVVLDTDNSFVIKGKIETTNEHLLMLLALTIGDRLHYEMCSQNSSYN